MSYIYLASPYTHPNPDIMQERYEHAARVTAEMLNRRQYVYSPIVHCHELACRHDLPRDINFWRDYNTAMLRLAGQLKVLKLEGWEQSVGVQFEMDLAKRLGIPIFFHMD